MVSNSPVCPRLLVCLGSSMVCRTSLRVLGVLLLRLSSSTGPLDALFQLFHPTMILQLIGSCPTPLVTVNKFLLNNLNSSGPPTHSPRQIVPHLQHLLHGNADTWTLSPLPTSCPQLQSSSRTQSPTFARGVLHPRLHPPPPFRPVSLLALS